MPKLTNEGFRVTVLKLMHNRSEQFDVYNNVALIHCFVEIRMMTDIMMGEIIVIDMN